MEVKTEGDAFFLVFPRASDAIRFALEAQLSVGSYPWHSLLEELHALRVRIGLHAGEPILGHHPRGDADYFGPTVNRAARVGGVGHGGQVVLSEATRMLALSELPDEIDFLNLGTHRLKGVGEEQLWQLLHPELVAEFKPIKTLNPQRHNLPLQGTPFIGREAEIQDLVEILQGEARLVSLAGFGGLGKTRLSLEVAELLADDFADGVWWVECEEARDGEAMLARIASELRLHLQPQPTIREQVLHFHRERELLLVLDNLEQIPDASKVVDMLLKAAPRVKCLVTTRRVLELHAERVYEVRPMPEAQAQTLFVERARARVADYELDEENRADIAELCRELEGVPLAIELAASRIAVLSPREILERLGERFRILQTRAPDLPPRQRALRGAIDWSYDLLVEEDRDLLAQLAVFAGGFSLEAAEKVAEVLDVFEGVAELRRHWLLRSEADATQTTRFAMLDSVRVYAAEKLAETPSEAAVRQRHAEYFLKLAQRLVSQFRTPAEGTALVQLTLENDNLRAALAWAQSTGRAELAAPLALYLYQALFRRGFWVQARECLETGLALAEPGAVRAELLLQRAGLNYDQGELVAAEADVREALAAFEAQSAARGRADALNLAGLLATQAGNWEEARRELEQALALRQPQEHHGRAIAMHNLARVAVRQGEREEARRLYEAALAERRAGGDQRGEAETLGDMGVLSFEAQDYTAAKGYYLQSLAVHRQLDDRLGIALMLYNLAEIAALEDERERASTFFVHAERIFRELQSGYEEAVAETLQGLQAKWGKAEFAALRANSEGRDWADLLG